MPAEKARRHTPLSGWVRGCCLLRVEDLQWQVLHISEKMITFAKF
jgi:hypothetical protein